MVSKIKLIWNLLTTKEVKKDPVAVEKAKESTLVRGLRRQVETYEEINIEYSNQIKAMAIELANHRDDNMQSKMLDMAAQFLMPKQAQAQSHSLVQHSPDAATQTTLESGVQYSDDQIMGIADSLGSGTIHLLKGMAFDKFKEVVQSKVPNISDESLLRAQQIIQVMD